MLFFASCGAGVICHLNITRTAFKIAGSSVLFLIAPDMQAANANSANAPNAYGAPLLTICQRTKLKATVSRFTR